MIGGGAAELLLDLEWRVASVGLGRFLLGGEMVAAIRRE